MRRTCGNDRLLKRTPVLATLFVVACLVVGLVLASLLDRQIKGEGVFRSIYLFPMAVSFIAVRWVATGRRAGMIPARSITTRNR